MIEESNVMRKKLTVYSGTNPSHKDKICLDSISIGSDRKKSKKQEYLELANIKLCIYGKSFMA